MAQQRCKFATDTHQRRVRRADDRTLPRQRDATRQHFDIILLETFGGAMFALRSTLIAKLDASAEHVTADNFVVHMASLSGLSPSLQLP